MTAPGDAALVRLAGIGRTFATGTVALDGLDLDLRRHELLSLLGPSGCGKSTVLRLVAGLDAPTAGTVTRAEGVVRPGAVGYVFQEPTLMPWATVFDNVRLPLRLAGGGGRENRDRVDAMIERVGLGGFAGAYPRELSGGMRMRVSIARALVTGPRLLLLDEPFAALDEITRFRLDDMLLDLWSRGDWTILFVTHSVFESVYLSTRIAVMASRPGRIVATRDVGAPFPRGDAFRTSHGFTDRCAEISDLLRRATTAGGPS